MNLWTSILQDGISETDQEDFWNVHTQVSAVSNLQARKSNQKITFQDIKGAQTELCKTLSPQTAVLNIDKGI